MTQALSAMNTTTLSTLEELYAVRDLLAMDKDAQRRQVIPAEVQHELDAIEAEFEDKEEMLTKRIEAAEKFLKDCAIANGKKITGTNFYVQYTKGGPQVKVDDVLRIADRWQREKPELAAELRSIITRKKDSATIKPVGT